MHIRCTITNIPYSIFSGTTYKFLLDSNLSAETKESIETLDFLFAPNNYPKSAGINIRNTIFGFGGRVLFNLVTDPQGTSNEFRDVTFDEIRTRLLSTDYLVLWLGRILFQAFCLVTGITILFIIGRSENGQTLRSFDTREADIDEIDRIVQQSLMPF